MCKKREEEKEYEDLKHFSGQSIRFSDFKAAFPILFEKITTPSKNLVGNRYYYRDLIIIRLFSGSFLKDFHITLRSEFV